MGFSAGGGCGRPATIRIMPPMSTMTARSIPMVTMSTMITTVFAPHYSHCGEKLSVSTAVGVGSKGIGFPLGRNIGKIDVGGKVLRIKYVFDLSDKRQFVHKPPFVPPTIFD